MPRPGGVCVGRGAAGVAQGGIERAALSFAGDQGRGLAAAMDGGGLSHGPLGTFQASQTTGTILCCICGVGMPPNPTNMCVNCVRTQVDITKDIPRRCTVIYCSTCGKYLQPPKHWLRAELESKELLTFCVKRLKGLNKVKLVDAGFIWTEPHSKQLKVKVTVQDEVLNGAILQQSCVVDYTVVYNMCGECIRANANPDQWVASVQVRQKVSHKRTFLFLEQLILKHGADKHTINVKDNADGLDFFFKSKSHALSFVDFLTQVAPVKQGKDSKELVSHDEHTSNYRYKFTFYCEIAHPCKDDLVVFDRRQSRALGGFGPLALVTRVSNNLLFTDPSSLRQVWLDATQYWRSPIAVIQDSKQLVEYLVLDIECVRGDYGRPIANGPYMLADAEVVKVRARGRRARASAHARAHSRGLAPACLTARCRR